MGIHPKYISRKHRKRTYVFVHRTAGFNGRLVGIRFVDGKSEPAPMLKATRLAAAMGGKIRFGYCVEEPHVFGDATPEEREDALRAAGGVGTTASPAERLEGLLARSVAAELAPPDEEEVDQMRQFLLARFEEVGEEGAHEALDSMEAELEQQLRGETSSDRDDDDDPATFVDTDSPQADEPHRLRRSDFDGFTKAQLDAWAQEHIGVSLNTRNRVDELLDEIFAHPKVVALPETEEEE